jgi:hypothetical protein
MWLRFSKKKQIAILDERLMRYRISHTQSSHSNRNRTERADFFLVIDHYLGQGDVRNILTKRDFRHYEWLIRHDKVARAFNLFILERINESKEMLQGVFCWDSIYAAMVNRRGLVTLAGAILLCLILPFGASKRALAIIKLTKNISWR